MNTKVVFVLGTLALSLVGCSKNAEVEEFIKFNDELAAEVSKKGEKDGPDAAQKAFDEKKGDLKVKYDAIKDAAGFQVSEDNIKKLGDSVTSSTMKVCGGQITLDQAMSDKFKKLCDDYTGTLN